MQAVQTTNANPISKQELVKTLTENRTRHLEEVTTALDGFRQKYGAFLQSQLDGIGTLSPETLAQARSRINNIMRTLPTSHVHSYDNALRRCNVIVGDTIFLTPDQEREQINDQWGWAGEHRKAMREYADSSSFAYAGSTGTEGAGSGRRSSRS